jgi:hypothetical protein
MWPDREFRLERVEREHGDALVPQMIAADEEQRGNATHFGMGPRRLSKRSWSYMIPGFGELIRKRGWFRTSYWRPVEVSQ